MKKISLLFLVLSFVLVSSAFAATLSGTATTDNAFDLYLSTDDFAQGATLIGGSTDWSVPLSFSSLSLTPGTYWLHAEGWDYGSIGGFLGEFSLTGNAYFQNNTQSLLTNTSDWTVRRNGWSDTNFEAPTLSTNYYGGTGTGHNGSAPWGTISGISGNADWIWTDNGDPRIYPPAQPNVYRYFSSKITVTPEPISAALFMLGGLAFSSRKFFSKKHS